MPSEIFLTAGLQAAVYAREIPFWKTAKSVLLFISMENEIRTLPLIETSVKEGKEVFAPRIENGVMNFYRMEKNTAFGAENFPAIIFTPGLAFDRKGNRLGRGKAFYDRFFTGLDKASLEYKAIGLCLACQIAESVPVEKHDKRMDYLCCENGIFPVQ